MGPYLIFYNNLFHSLLQIHSTTTERTFRTTSYPKSVTGTNSRPFWFLHHFSIRSAITIFCFSSHCTSNILLNTESTQINLWPTCLRPANWWIRGELNSILFFAKELLSQLSYRPINSLHSMCSWRSCIIYPEINVLEFSRLTRNSAP
jgi:hypothetical protein